jgi:hypothetical protein
VDCDRTDLPHGTTLLVEIASRPNTQFFFPRQERITTGVWFNGVFYPIKQWAAVKM